jgi:hypothetical protein
MQGHRKSLRHKKQTQGHMKSLRWKTQAHGHMRYLRRKNKGQEPRRFLRSEKQGTTIAGDTQRPTSPEPSATQEKRPGEHTSGG